MTTSNRSPGPDHARILNERCEQLLHHLDALERDLHEARVQLLAATGGADDLVRLREIVHGVPVFLWTAGEDRRLEYASVALREYLGCGDDARMPILDDAIHPEDRRRWEWAWQQMVETRRPLAVEIRLAMRDGTTRWFAVRVVPLPVAVPMPARWGGSCVETGAVPHLEGRSSERWLLELAHELRNPLMTISAALDLMPPDDRPDVGRRLEIVARQVARIGDLVDALLHPTHWVTGTVPVHLGVADVRTVAEEAAEVCGPLLDSRRHELTIDISPDVCARADPRRLVQVVSNLLANAAKYSRLGGRIRIAATVEGDEVALRVEDDGIGMSPDLLLHVFEPFVQGDRHDSDVPPGLGLGLTIVRDLVNLQGGTVTAASEGLGRGSTFTVRMPVAAPLPATSAHRLASPHHPAGPGRRILVVDDSVDVTEVLTDMLRSEGHRVAVAHSAAAAVKLATRFRPDVAVIDLGLPEVDGYELAERLQHELGEDCPRLVALTGYGGQSEERLRQCGFARQIIKPVDLHLLLAIVAEDGATRRRRRRARRKTLLPKS